MGWVGDFSAEGPAAQRWRRPAGGAVATGCSTPQSPAASPPRCSSAAAAAEARGAHFLPLRLAEFLFSDDQAADGD
eukprot:7962834-Alexandrium_andersonii.AAC.1